MVDAKIVLDSLGWLEGHTGCRVTFKIRSHHGYAFGEFVEIIFDDCASVIVRLADLSKVVAALNALKA